MSFYYSIHYHKLIIQQKNVVGGKISVNLHSVSHSNFFQKIQRALSHISRQR